LLDRGPEVEAVHRAQERAGGHPPDAPRTRTSGDHRARRWAGRNGFPPRVECRKRADPPTGCRHPLSPSGLRRAGRLARAVERRSRASRRVSRQRCTGGPERSREGGPGAPDVGGPLDRSAASAGRADVPRREAHPERPQMVRDLHRAVLVVLPGGGKGGSRRASAGTRTVRPDLRRGSLSSPHGRTPARVGEVPPTSTRFTASRNAN